MTEKESFFSKFFGNKKKEGCCCRLKVTKNEGPSKPSDGKFKSDNAKEEASKR